jgi:hypothetical protein
MSESLRHTLALQLDRFLSDEARLGDPDLRPDQVPWLSSSWISARKRAQSVSGRDDSTEDGSTRRFVGLWTN